MKISKELVNGFIIVLGIGLYFLLMQLLGLGDIYLLRVFNVLFIFYGTNRTLKSNYDEGNVTLASNSVSAFSTAATGVILSIISLITYSYMRLCVLGVRVALDGLCFAEKHRDAPYAGKAHERVDHAADRAHLTAAEERDEVKAEQADAAPVERADDGER